MPRYIATSREAPPRAHSQCESVEGNGDVLVPPEAEKPSTEVVDGVVVADGELAQLDEASEAAQQLGCPGRGYPRGGGSSWPWCVEFGPLRCPSPRTR